MSKAKCPNCGTHAITEGYGSGNGWLVCIICEKKSKEIKLTEASKNIAEDLPDWFENE